MDVSRDLVLSMIQTDKSYKGYGLQKECEAFVNHILVNMAKSPMPVMKPDQKNEEESIEYREEGNQHFVAGDDIEAIESYTMSLAYANTTELMAYAHANRSAALYRKKMYKECLIDIDTALELGYPKEKREKLKERGAKALAEVQKLLGIAKNAKKESINGNGHIEDESEQGCPFGSTEGPVPNKKFPLIATVAEDAPKKSEKIEAAFLDDNFGEKTKRVDMTALPSSSVKPRHSLDQDVMNLRYGPNEEAPALSAGVRINYSEEYGRHLVATREFQPGDLLTIEDPYAWVIYRNKFYTHCHHCLERCYNMIPCPHCPLSMYCSDKCRKASWVTAHRIECPVLSVLVTLLNIDEDKVRMLIMMKIMRLVITATDNGKKIDALRADMKIAESNPDPRTAGFTDEGILDSKNPRSAMSLATNMRTRPLIGISAFACISGLSAILLATQSDFFGKKYDSEELKNIEQLKDIVFCGSVMFRACVITSSNCFSMQQDPGVKSGSGLFVVHSLYNHSCAPNTFRHFEGLTMLTRALEPLRPGDQIFTGYGADHAHMTKAARKAKLMEQYFFDCKCPACLHDWPMYADILKNHIGSISTNKQLVERLKPFKQRLLDNKYDIDAVKRILEILHGDVTKPCEEILHATGYLKSYYLDP